MDASAYLQKQGWRGDGHSLDHSDRGIKKPLLVSKKVDVLGVGLNKHQAVSDQWWLRAFDQGLKTFGTGKESALGAVQKHGINRGGLYARFTRGEGVPGSIGQSPVDGSEAGTGTNTPVNVQSGAKVTVAVDVPSADELSRTNGNGEDQKHHDAMMQVLQNPDEGPTSMHNMSDKKRKCAEQHVEKRARRKVERNEKSKKDGRGSRRRVEETSTWEYEQERERREQKMIKRQVKEVVSEAQRRGIIPTRTNKIRKGLVSANGSGGSAQNEPSEAFVAIVALAGLDAHSPCVAPGEDSEKTQKYIREQAKRAVKRAAKAYLVGGKPVSERSMEEPRTNQAKKKEQTAERKAAAAQREAEKMAGRKRQARATRKAEREEIGMQTAEARAHDNASSGDLPNGDVAMLGTTNFDTGADEVTLSISSRGGSKSVPGVSIVDRYPTKAGKKVKKPTATVIKGGVTEEDVKRGIAAEQAQKASDEKLQVDRYRAMKRAVSLEEYEKAQSNIQPQASKVQRKELRPEKLAEYMKRAQQKGVTLEEYIRRRGEKYTTKQAEKVR